ncbi:AlpA family phage regulatory protein [Acidisphaera sp. L21]|uniref:helix-turn-helix transcriptional regulator n=1 Tax=Acidisphaera sp. L21 TaxID=1641851 RepID=UPI00131C85C3
MTEAFLRYPEVVRRTGFCRSSIERLVRTSDFPAPRKIGERAVAWLESEVTAWMQSRPQVGYKVGTADSRSGAKSD